MRPVTSILILLFGLSWACSPRPAETETEKNRKAEERAAIAQFVSTQEGVFREIEPGIWVDIIRKGDSLHPKLSDIITVTYTTQDLNGFEIDHSDESNPLRMRLARLIPAWQTALPRIGIGGRMRLITVSDEAYGSRSIHPQLGAWTPLYFEIGLLKIE